MKKVYVKEELCMGCGLCEVYCKAQHSRSNDLIKAFNKESPPTISRLWREKNGVVSFPVQCRHCDDSYCVQSCLTGSLRKDTAGIVHADEEKCIGCWTCVLACPYGAIKRDISQKRIAKCDLCQGEDMPVCVKNCPNEALIYAEAPENARIKIGQRR